MLERNAELLQAMGHGTRLRILALLNRGDRCVCEIQAALKEPQPNISRHLAILRHAGLVRARRVRNRVVYRLADPRVATLIEEVDVLAGVP
jgi:ArsR family transcriptional regulator